MVKISCLYAGYFLCYNENMTDEVKIALISLISAGITALFSFLGNLVLSKRKSHEEEIREAKRQQYQDDRDDYFEEQLDKVNKKLDEHNHYAKKFESVDIKMTAMQKDIEYLRKDFNNVTCRPKTTKKD